MSHQSLAPKKERQSNLELLRIIAMFMVVIYHFAERMSGGVTFEPSQITFNSIAVRILASFGNTGNNLFVLVCGYFLVRSSFKLRHALRLWAEVFFYSALIGVIFLACGRGLTGRTLYLTFAPFLSLQYWFFTCYITFYFFVPFLNRLILSLERAAFRRLNILMFVFFSLFNTVLPGSFGSFSSLAMFFLLYCLAAYVRLYPDAVGVFDRPWRCFAAAAAILLFRAAYLCLCARFGDRFSFLRPDRFNAMASVPQLLFSLLLFLGFLHLRMPRVRVVNTIASACFGVYIIHFNHFLRDGLWHWMSGVLHLADTPALLPLLALGALAVYGVCTLIDLARQRFIEPLYMRLIDRVPPVRRELEKAQERCKAKT
mgnify:CR=1 FL=1